jgi:hypothetical protein
MKKKTKISRDTKGRITKGSKLAMKYETRKEQLELIKRFCRHIENGYSQESFPEADVETVKNYANTITEELKSSNSANFTIFPTTLIQRALRISQKKWEHMGMQGMLNKIRFFNAHIWALNMRNRFNWDKDDKTPKEMMIDRKITVNFVRDDDKPPA